MKKRLSRRLVLRGLGGAAITLPLLEFNGAAFAQEVKVAKRFVLFFEHGGTIHNRNKSGALYDGRTPGYNDTIANGTDAWKPADPGEALVPGAIHQPLTNHNGSSLTSDLLVLRGIDGPGRKGAPYQGDHGYNNVMALTCVKYSGSGDSAQAQGPSFDQVLAGRLMQRSPTRFPSYCLEVPGHDYGSPFFRGAGERFGGQFNPWKAFQTLFSGVTTGGSTPDPAAVRAKALRKSVLDGTSTMLSGYRDQLSSTDKQTIEVHLEHIRSIELRLQRMSLPTAPVCSKPTMPQGPSGEPDWYYFRNLVTAGPEIGELQADLMIAALRCGLTNVLTLNIGDMHTKWLSPNYDVGYDIGHSLHHESGELGGDGTAKWQAWYETILANRRWRMSLMARVLDGLKRTPEGTQNMLYNTVALWTSEFALGADHTSADMPMLLAGQGGGALRTGRHLNFNTKASLANPNPATYATTRTTHNLFVSILNAFGYNDTTFGDMSLAYGSGPLPGLS